MDAVLASAYRLAGRPAGVIQPVLGQMRALVKDLRAELDDFATMAYQPVDPESLRTHEKVVQHTYRIDFIIKGVESMMKSLEDAQPWLTRLIAL